MQANTQALSDSFTRNIRMDGCLLFMKALLRELTCLLCGSGRRVSRTGRIERIQYDEEMKNSQYLEINVSVAY